MAGAYADFIPGDQAVTDLVDAAPAGAPDGIAPEGRAAFWAARFEEALREKAEGRPAARAWRPRRRGGAGRAGRVSGGAAAAQSPLYDPDGTGRELLSPEDIDAFAQEATSGGGR